MKEMILRLESWMNDLEDENLEFKEAKSNFNFEKLAKYCCALANENGGGMILGVTDKRPRKVVGTRAFEQPERTRNGLMEKLPLLIRVDEIAHPDGRVLAFTVPPRPVGMPIQYEGVAWSRRGDSLVPLTHDRLRKIFDESGHDFSADICPGLDLSDLSVSAVEEFRKRWIVKSKNQSLAGLDREQLLRDAEAITDDGVTYAALILFGKREAIRKHRAQAEVVFEYRSSDSPGPAQLRDEHQEAFFEYYNRIWNAIAPRNDMQHYQDGPFVLDIPTFDESTVREAVLNAVSHRDYNLGGNVFIRQYRDRIVFESPGGFPLGITVENAVDRQNPRNRRIAEIFAKCGLVERSGQGMDLMYERSIRNGKLPPDFTGSDQYQVALTLHCVVRDPAFVRFIESVSRESGYRFSTHDLQIVDYIHRGLDLPESYCNRLPILAEHGIVEKTGRGRGVKYTLSRRFYQHIGKSGTHTRLQGLDRETNKELLFKHIRQSESHGATMSEFQQVLPGLSRREIQGLIGELRETGKIRMEGERRGARYFPEK